MSGFDLSPACLPPTQPSVTADDRAHPRYPEFAAYRAAMTRQLVTGCNFASWLESTERDEHGFTSVFEVTSPLAQLAPGWWRNEFGPGHRLIVSAGPFDTEAQARADGAA